MAWRLLVSLPARLRSRERVGPAPPRTLPEFTLVNRRAGIEPLRPELSGLRLRRPTDIPRRVTRLLVTLRYRWQPSAEWRRRQEEVRHANATLGQRLRRLSIPPPIQRYGDDLRMTPDRVQPRLDPDASVFAGRNLPFDLRDLAEAEQHRVVPTITPHLAEVDPEYFHTDRPLLPRPARQFIRHSPYPRVVAGITAGALGVVGFVWVSQLRQAEAEAAGRLHVARDAFQGQLAVAGTYGVDPRLLQPLVRHAHTLAATPVPVEFLVNRSRLQFLRQQTRAYATLQRTLRLLERSAFAYWSRREGQSQRAARQARSTLVSLGLPITTPPIPACTTPRCFRAAVSAQVGRTAWMRETAGTLRTYAGMILSAADPMSAAAAEIGEAHKLAGDVHGAVALPAPLAGLDGAQATAGSDAASARAGALAHLDVDRLQSRLTASLSRRAIAVSSESQTVTLYVKRRAVYATAATISAATPLGIFHIQVSEASVPATYWQREAGVYHYRYGAIPDWMSFDNGVALQGAPWRTVFGPGSAGAVAAFAPDTPGSIDLPAAAAAFLFRAATPGTEVVVY